MAELSHLDLTMKYLDRSVFLNSDHPILASCLNPNQFAWNFQSCYFFHHHGMNTPLMGMPPAKCYPSTFEWMYFFPDVSWQSHLHFTWSPPKPPWSTFGCIFFIVFKTLQLPISWSFNREQKGFKKEECFFLEMRFVALQQGDSSCMHKFLGRKFQAHHKRANRHNHH